MLNLIGLHPLDRCDDGMLGQRPVETWEGEPLRVLWRMRAVNWDIEEI